MIDSVRETNERLSADDAPRWAEILGIALALGLFIRDNCHVAMALITDVDPSFRKHDLTAKSPVAAIETGSKTDLAARLLAVGMGVVCIEIVLVTTRPLFRAYLIAQVMVPLADPLLLASTRIQK